MRQKLIEGGECAEAAFAHYALHRLKMLPSTFAALPFAEKAFVIASIELQVQKEKDAQSRAKNRKPRK